MNSPYVFADHLVDTGVKHSPAIPLLQGKVRANTREGAFDLIAEKLECPRESFKEYYLDHYEMVSEFCRMSSKRTG